MGSGVADEVSKDVLLEIRLRVRGGWTQTVEGREERCVAVPRATIHGRFPPPPGAGIRLAWRDALDEIPEALDRNVSGRHGSRLAREWCPTPFDPAAVLSARRRG